MAAGAASFELLTPPGLGGVAVVRVWGDGARQAAAQYLRLPDSGLPEVGAGPILAGLLLEGERVDDVLVVTRQTGDVELHLHGAPALVAALERAVGGFHARPASRGERLLRGAETRAHLELGLEQAAETFEAFLSRIARLDPRRRAAELSAAERRSVAALAQCESLPLVLCGAQNAGKSTLMNRLLFSERVLAGPTPGLTRDPVVESVVLAGYGYELCDTAGDGDAASEVDRRALERTRARVEGGGLRLLLVAADRLPSARDRALVGTGTVVVRSKADLPAVHWPADFQADLDLCCLDPGRSSAIRWAVGEALRRHRGLPAAGPVGGFAALDRAEFEQLRAVRYGGAAP